MGQRVHSTGRLGRSSATARAPHGAARSRDRGKGLVVVFVGALPLLWRGLRDLHALFWAAKFLYRVDSVDEMVEQLRGLRREEKATLADALAGLTPDTLDGISQALNGLSFDTELDVAKELQSLFLENGEKLVDALRNNALDRVDRSTDSSRPDATLAASGYVLF